MAVNKLEGSGSILWIHSFFARDVTFPPRKSKIQLMIRKRGRISPLYFAVPGKQLGKVCPMLWLPPSFFLRIQFGSVNRLSEFLDRGIYLKLNDGK